MDGTTKTTTATPELPALTTRQRATLAALADFAKTQRRRRLGPPGRRGQATSIGKAGKDAGRME